MGLAIYGKRSWYIAHCPLYGRCPLFGVSAKRGSTVYLMTNQFQKYVYSMIMADDCIVAVPGHYCKCECEQKYTEKVKGYMMT